MKRKQKKRETIEFQLFHRGFYGKFRSIGKKLAEANLLNRFPPPKSQAKYQFSDTLRLRATLTSPGQAQICLPKASNQVVNQRLAYLWFAYLRLSILIC